MKAYGAIDKYKARLVLKGYKQREGLDYFDTYSPVTRITSIRMLICGDPQARPNPVGESEPKPRGRSVEVINQIPFVSVLLNFSFKSVAT